MRLFGAHDGPIHRAIAPDVSDMLVKNTDYYGLSKIECLFMRQELEAIYERYRTQAIDLLAEDLKTLSPPLLVRPTDRWARSQKRILLVGQETFGWSFHADDTSFPYYTYRWKFNPMKSMIDFRTASDAVLAMTSAYEFFSFSEYQPSNRNAPLWSFYRELRQITGDKLSGFDSAVLWTNLYRQDFNGGPIWKAPKHIRDEVSLMNRRILREEVAVLKPTDVIFCTGPDYDEELSRQFSGITYDEAVDGVPVRQLARLSHGELPESSFRIYHPNYIRRSGRRSLLDRLIEMVGASDKLV